MLFAWMAAWAGVSSGTVTVNVGCQAERLVVAVTDVAALQRSLRLQLARVAGDRRIDDGSRP